MTRLPVCSGEVNGTIASSTHYCVPTTCAYTIYTYNTHHILCNMHLNMYTPKYTCMCTHRPTHMHVHTQADTHAHG